MTCVININHHFLRTVFFLRVIFLFPLNSPKSTGNFWKQIKTRRNQFYENYLSKSMFDGAINICQYFQRTTAICNQKFVYDINVDFFYCHFLRVPTSLPINVTGYAACRFKITNFSAYKYINLWNIIVIFTTNCGMQYEPALWALCFLFSVDWFFFFPCEQPEINRKL